MFSLDYVSKILRGMKNHYLNSPLPNQIGKFLGVLVMQPVLGFTFKCSMTVFASAWPTSSANIIYINCFYLILPTPEWSAGFLTENYFLQMQPASTLVLLLSFLAVFFKKKYTVLTTYSKHSVYSNCKCLFISQVQNSLFKYFVSL